MKTLDDFVAEGPSRETADEVMQAIAYIARDYAEAVRIWEAPSNEECIAIWEGATKNGSLDDDLPWGVSNLREVNEQFATPMEEPRR